MSLSSMLKSRMQVCEADVQRRHGGDHEYTFDTSGPSFPCDVQPLEAQKRITLEAMDVLATHVLRWRLPDVTLNDKCRIKVGDVQYKVRTLAQPVNQSPNYPAKAFIEEAPAI